MCKCAETIKPKRVNRLAAFAAQDAPDGPLVRIAYQGGGMAKQNVYGAVTRRFYGRRVRGEKFLVEEPDAQAQPDVFQAV